jgi:RNA polymerase sigma factor (sigma-70 family)
MSYLEQWPEEFSAEEIRAAAKAASRHQPEDPNDRDDFWQQVRIAAWRSLEKEKLADPGRRADLVGHAAYWAAREYWLQRNSKKEAGRWTKRRDQTVGEFHPLPRRLQDGLVRHKDGEGEPVRFWREFPDEVAQEPEFSDGLLRLIAAAQLTDDQARAVELHYCRDMPIPEAASLMRMDVQVVRRLVKSGLRKLQKAIGK